MFSFFEIYFFKISSVFIDNNKYLNKNILVMLLQEYYAKKCVIEKFGTDINHNIFINHYYGYTIIDGVKFGILFQIGH